MDFIRVVFISYLETLLSVTAIVGLIAICGRIPNIDSLGSSLGPFHLELHNFFVLFSLVKKHDPYYNDT